MVDELTPLQQHAATILHLLTVEPDLTQQQLTERVRLRRTRVFDVMTRLHAVGLLQRDEPTAAGRNKVGGPARGRPSTTWRWCGTAGRFLTVHLGMRHTRLAWYDMAGQPTAPGTCDLPATTDVDEALASIAKHVQELEIRGLEHPLRGVALMLAGRVAPDLDEVVLSQPWGLHRQPLASRLRLVLDLPPDCPVIVENQVHAAALGEATAGQGRDGRCLMTVCLQGGRAAPQHMVPMVGSGLVWDGRILKGRIGALGELDDVAHQWRIQHPTGRHAVSLHDYHQDAVRHFALELGERLLPLVNFLSPERLVLQVVEETAHPTFVQALTQCLVERQVGAVGAACQVVESSLDDAAILLGGLAALRFRCLSDARALRFLLANV